MKPYWKIPLALSVYPARWVGGLAYWYEGIICRIIGISRWEL